MNYQPLTPKTMPPIDNQHYFLLWRGTKDIDGGFPVMAKRVQYGMDPPYIRYVTPTGWKSLDDREKKTSLWAEIPTPEAVQQRLMTEA